MSDEFKNEDIPDGDYVDILYCTFFDRKADQGGRATWTEALEGFSRSEEFGAILRTYGL